MTIAAAQARKPRERMKIREILVCRLMFRPQTTGIGRTAKKKSVMMLIAGIVSAWPLLMTGMGSHLR